MTQTHDAVSKLWDKTFPDKPFPINNTTLLLDAPTSAPTSQQERAENEAVVKVVPWLRSRYRRDGEVETYSFEGITPRDLAVEYQQYRQQEQSTLTFEKWVGLEVLAYNFSQWVAERVFEASDYLEKAQYKLSKRTNRALNAATVLRRLAGVSPSDYKGQEELPNLLGLLHNGDVTEEKLACVVHLTEFLSLSLTVARMNDWLALYGPMNWFFRGHSDALESEPESYSSELWELFLQNDVYAMEVWNTVGLTHEEFLSWWECEDDESTLDEVEA